MDDIAHYNKERWETLAEAGVMFSRPFLELDEALARQVVDPHGMLGAIAGSQVLCLAGGGGQQSVAFALLGARTTVFDLSETQLKRDREAAAHYGLSITSVQGDMRDLSRFEDRRFDLVWQAYSINFIPAVDPLFDEVARVLRPGGLYRLECANPFVFELDETRWTAQGYPLRQPYADGEMTFDDPHWDIEDDDGTSQRVVGPREFRHTLSTLLNGLAGRGFILLHAAEERTQEAAPKPGTWEHLKWIAPPWLTFWFAYRP